MQLDEFDLPASCHWDDACRSLLDDSGGAVLLDGRGFEEGWTSGPLVAWALEPLVGVSRGALDHGLRVVARTVAARRREGGTAGTGIVLALSYEAGASCRRVPSGPLLVAFEIDRSLRRLGERAWRVTLRGPAAAGGPQLGRRLAGLPQDVEPRRGLRGAGRPRTSLPRESYIGAVRRLQAEIARGEIYQANLCQRLSVPVTGDALELYLALAGRSPAPHSAFLRSGRRSLASISPETFLRSLSSGQIETWPIKGTRPRGVTRQADDERARELLESEKDRAELVMIVDLERNDLGRLCVPGTVAVDPLLALRSYPEVHHLVSKIHGRLRDRVGLLELVAATFPGGSISGAPKRRAIELLEQVEPVARGFFTGSLLFFADDGSVDSSILIRTIELAHDGAIVGAGGGIVADSDPHQEWLESNHKARALAHALGFDPEEAR